jgi:NADH:ubiquinone oxidoreductase subunit 6 (subunit J)
VVVLRTWPVAQFGEPVAATAEVLRGSTVDIGQAMVNPEQYVLPFELISILLLAALVGAVVIAWPEKKS